MLNAPPRNHAPRELRVKIPPELDVKIRTVKLMTGVGLSDLVVLALEGYLQNLARERRAAMNAVIEAAEPAHQEGAETVAVIDVTPETGPALTPHRALV